MIPVRYFGINACKLYGFPYIYSELTESENAPDYESEPEGIAELEKVLEFVKNDSYYPNFSEKSAYIICSIAGSQYFSNGNKRLSIVTLLMFLQLNDTLIRENYKYLRKTLSKYFPKHVWEENPNIQLAHSLFLYNLAIIIGDRARWEIDDFAEVRQRVGVIFSDIHARMSEIESDS